MRRMSVDFASTPPPHSICSLKKVHIASKIHGSITVEAENGICSTPQPIKLWYAFNYASVNGVVMLDDRVPIFFSFHRYPLERMCRDRGYEVYSQSH